MKKATGTALYNGATNQIYNFTINHKGNLIPLIRYDLNGVKPYQYENFQQLYKALLQIAKNNGFYFGNYKEFGAIWYDIQFINVLDPVTINKFGKLEEA